jgi:hypothetical protein
LPLGFSAAAKAATEISPDEIACAKRRFEDENLSLIGLRFKGDPIVTPRRLILQKRVRRPVQAIELDDEHAEPAPGLPTTFGVDVEPARQRRSSSMTRQTERRVIAFFKERTGA